MIDFVILPHQLYNIKNLNVDENNLKNFKYILWEHPHYFTKYNHNKKKLILHYASMLYYYDYLKQKKFNVSYIKFNEKFTSKDYYLFDPIDKINLPNKYTFVESPNFLLTTKQYELYRKKTKNFFFNSFYMWGKKQIDMIPNIKSLDKENRNSIPKDLKIPPIPTNNSDKKYINKAIKLVEKNFPKNCGNTNNFIFPISHKVANNWITHFIKYKLNNFGKYQDAIIKENNFLFHSLLSTSINIGLLNPIDVANKILKEKVKMNNIEGFIRQLFWREYQRYCYIYFNFTNKSYFPYTINKLSKEWYNGTTGIKPIDVCINNAFNNGYLHHIERLMVVGNFMVLSNINPKAGHQWFMEFSCDSYEWVMAQNVYDMVFFVSGGKTMRRPYISSSNYVLKMSNYKKEDWCDIWDEKYNTFLKKNKQKLWKYRYFFRGFKN